MKEEREKNENRAAGIVIVLFLTALLTSVLLGTSLVYALLFGLALFGGYARYCGFSFRQIGDMIWEGARKSGKILTIMLLVGMLTASWRAGGTIPCIVTLGMGVIRPGVFYLSLFLLSCAVSFITGTSFGTVSTVGVVSMILARVNGFDLLLSGGAVMSGAYFGDRCSPMSSSAALVCSLTGVDTYTNLKHMLKSGALPFGLSCVAYLLLSGGPGEIAQKAAVDFSPYFDLSWLTLFPAFFVLFLSLCRVDIRITMGASILAASALSLLLQKAPAGELLGWLITGYRPEADGQIASMLSGGGIVSMLRVVLVVLLSSAFFGIFRQTGILSSLEGYLLRLMERWGRFPAMVLTSLVTCAFSCNQTLATMLTCGLCEKAYPDKERLANDLEDSVIVIAGLIPWSIACAVPLAVMEADFGCMGYAFYLYLLPLAGLLRGKRRKINPPAS